MKQIYFLIAMTVFLLNGNKMNAQTEWTGPILTFSKASNADWTLEANQDRITSNVWLTRENNNMLFNIAVNAYPTDAIAIPDDTEWAIGSISDGVSSLTFGEFLDIVVDSDGDACPPCGLNTPMVLHLITDDIYIDFTLTSWNEETTAPPGDGLMGFGNPGGQFTYQRSTDQSLSTNEFELGKDLTVYPNPSSEFIKISNLKSTKSYRIYNVLGNEIKNGIISNNEQIDIRDLTNGLYFLKFDNRTIKLLKE